MTKVFAGCQIAGLCFGFGTDVNAFDFGFAMVCNSRWMPLSGFVFFTFLPVLQSSKRYEKMNLSSHANSPQSILVDQGWAAYTSAARVRGPSGGLKHRRHLRRSGE